MKLYFDLYQQKAHTTANVYEEAIRRLFESETLSESEQRLYNLTCLNYVSNGLGESGEVQGKVKKLLRDNNGVISESSITEIGKELGDILWYVAEMCSRLGLSMSEVAQSNLDKLASRKERGVIQGSGDNR